MEDYVNSQVIDKAGYWCYVTDNASDTLLVCVVCLLVWGGIGSQVALEPVDAGEVESACAALEARTKDRDGSAASEASGGPV